MTPGASPDLSVFSHLLIVLIYTIHGILIGLLDLGDESALGFPVADGHHSSANRAHLILRYPHNNLQRAKRKTPNGRKLGYSRQYLDPELAQALIKKLQQPRLPRVEDLSLLADGIPLAPANLIPQDDFPPDHARGHAEAPQLGLDGVAQRHVVLGGDGPARGVDDARGDDEVARGDGARAREVDGGEGPEVGCYLGGGPAREEQRHVARQVGAQLVDAFRGGVLGVLAQRAGHELRLAEEESVVRWEGDSL